MAFKVYIFSHNIIIIFIKNVKLFCDPKVSFASFSATHATHLIQTQFLVFTTGIRTVFPRTQHFVKIDPTNNSINCATTSLYIFTGFISEDLFLFQCRKRFLLIQKHASTRSSLRNAGQLLPPHEINNLSKSRKFFGW